MTSVPPDPADAASQSVAADPGSAGYTEDRVALERAFLHGLGVADLHLPEGLTVELMHSIGALLRESTQGTIDLLRLRAEAKSSLHADMTMLGSRALNPLKAAWDAGVAVEHLLAPQRHEMMEPVRAVADAYDDLRAHDRGLAAGIHAAVSELLARFAPAEIEARVGEATAMDHLLPASRKARQWELLVERYEDFEQETKDDIWAVFEKEFRRAYASGESEPPLAPG